VIVSAIPEPVRLDVVARAASRQRLPCAFKLPRVAGAAVGDAMVVACNPVRVILGDSVEELAAAWAEERSCWGDSGLPCLPIGAGYLSYDLGFQFERVRGQRLPASPWPLLEFRFYDALVRIAGGTGSAQVWARDEHAAARIADALLSSTAAHGVESACAPGAGLAELEPPRAHLDAVARALEYIRAGDTYQVNLARRLQWPFATPPGDAPGRCLFLRLETSAPAPYAFWMADGERGEALVGNSPERFLCLSKDGVVETSPIKGTRPHDAAMPAARAAELLAASAKDRAEHVMIVDLERNDLGRVCQIGSVEVAELCRVLTLPTVCHLESTVRGRLRTEVGLAALLRATFPGGSITGAPKLRAMEIIEELEPARRGPYTGATGWLGAAGDLDLALAIRTALVRDGQLTLWVGGGIVADSTPEAELAETWDKARAFTDALG
jgi:para-aminobenzoate synthetase component 1